MQIGSPQWKALVIEGAGGLGLAVTPQQAEAFATHAREMLRWNRVTNLTAITDPRDVAIKHFIDAVAPAGLIPAGARLLDVGSGGGFPGIPLKIVIPSLTVTLIDSSRKKVSFLKHVIRTLRLEKIEALHGRVQELAGRPDMKAAFDVVVSRALTDGGAYVGWVLPLLAPKGFGLALKGRSFLGRRRGARGSDEAGGLPGVAKETPGVVFSHTTYRLPPDGSLRVLVSFRRDLEAACGSAPRCR
jgi:16S rRNA (guanine527-N7)-methyltransferase